MSHPAFTALSTPEQIAQATRHLLQAHDSARSVSPVRHLLAEQDFAGAYEVQTALNEYALQNGRRQSGRKAGLTSIAAQQAVKSDAPMSGMLFSDMEVFDGATLPSARLIAPRAEAEIAFVMRRDLDDPQAPIAHVIQAIDFVLPAIEIVDTRIADWDVQAIDLIADQAGAAHYVLGTRPVLLEQADLKLCGATLEIDGEPSGFGIGMANMGHPIHSLCWIARQLAEFHQPLRAGEVVLSGTLTPAVPLRFGQTIHVSIHGIGDIGFHLADKDN